MLEETIVAQHLLARVRLVLVLLFIASGLLAPVEAVAHEDPRIDAYVFWRFGCPYCEKARRRQKADGGSVSVRVSALRLMTGPGEGHRYPQIDRFSPCRASLGDGRYTPGNGPAGYPATTVKVDPTRIRASRSLGAAKHSERDAPVLLVAEMS